MNTIKKSTFDHADEAALDVEEWSIASTQHRKKMQLDLILSLEMPEGAKILDVGGKDHFDFFQSRPENYTMVDITDDIKHGRGGGHNLHPDGDSFDGKTLPYTPGSFDIILLSYCLHHASEYSLGLLEQAATITDRYILIAEDLSGITYPKWWLNRNHKHEAGGMFRSQIEWEGLFKLFGLSVERRICIRRDSDLDKDHFYRMNWLLRKTTD